MANVLSPPTVRIRVGEPFHLQGAGRLGDDEGVPTETDGATLDADTEAIMAAIVDLLPPEARVRRTPTRAELAATYPNGSVPDDVDLAAEHEADRRPGTD
jgi:putative phosphoserine phosphatase/1-acylglycerol-3-phosphate O-acyltransferase